MIWADIAHLADQSDCNYFPEKLGNAWGYSNDFSLTAQVTLERSADIGSLCPGGALAYTCSITFDQDQDVYLEWVVTLPGLEPVKIRYTNESTINFFNIDSQTMITSVLRMFQQAEYIESFLLVIIPNNLTYGSGMVQCSLSDIASNSSQIMDLGK